MSGLTPPTIPIKNASGDLIPQAGCPVLELSLLPLFAGTNPADLGLLLRAAWVQHFSDGTILFKGSEDATRLYVILDGHVELFIEDDHGRNVLEVAKSPTLLGEASLSGPGPYMESARIVGHSRLLVIPAAAFAAVLAQRFDLGLRLLGSMSGRLHGLVTQISSLKVKSTAQRLGSFLLGIADNQSGQTTARFPYDKRLVAEFLGMSAESLSRALARLVPVGVTNLGDNQVLIADLAALQDFCGEDTTE